MFHDDVQVDYSQWHVSCLALRKLLLPQSVTEIGEEAFSFLIELEELSLPESLIAIGEAAFTDCYSLTASALSFPEGLEFIGYQAFYDCFNLAGEIEFPHSLRYLLGGTFYQCRLTKISLPENLEGLGMFDFAGCRLTEVYVPDNCYLDPMGRQFYSNIGLTKAHLPEHADNVPIKIFGNCKELSEVNIPIDARYIYEDAFQDCYPIKEAIFPEGLLSIGRSAFLSCALTELDFPSTLEELGLVAFGKCGLVSSIRCHALHPPFCQTGDYRGVTACPFGDYENYSYGIRRDIPVYVPVGTKELYEQSVGWDYFTNFIETDFTTGMDNLSGEERQQDTKATPVYDIHGRRVNEQVPGQIYIREGKKEIIPN